MAFPNIANFGVVDNPLIDSPFVIGDEFNEFNPPPLTRRFLLLNGNPMLLLNGNDLLLL